MDIKKEVVRGSQLKVSESTVYKMLGFPRMIRAFLFGGVYEVNDPDNQKSLAVKRKMVIYIPNIVKRFYFKTIVRYFNGFLNGVEKINGTKKYKLFRGLE